MKKSGTSRSSQLTYAGRVSGWLLLLSIVGTLLTACSDQPTPLPTPPAPPTASPAPTIVADATVPVMPTGPSATAVPVPTATAAPPTATPVPKAAQPLNLMIIMDYHGNGTSASTSAGQGYTNLPTWLTQNPQLKLSASISGDLIDPANQIQVASNTPSGTLVAKNAATLTADDKLFMLTHFFEVSDAQIVQFPRYLELQRKRGDKLDATSLKNVIPNFTTDDWRDLQVMYSLSQLPPQLLRTPSINAIVVKVLGFSEQDKAVIVAAQKTQGQSLGDQYQTLQKNGQLDLVTAPYDYGVAPLLANSNDVRDLISKDATLPAQNFSFASDVTGQLQKSQTLLRTQLNATPAGALPAYGAISADSVSAFSAAGVTWLVSGETVLAGSLDQPDFQRDSKGTVQKAGQLYQPYQYSADGKNLTLFFQDKVLADQLASGYAGQTPAVAAADFIKRLKAINAELTTEKASGDPHVVTLVLDGTTAFSGYAGNGAALLAELTKELAAENTLQLTTPDAYIKQHPATTKLAKLATGSWADSFDKWIGANEQNQAWAYLAQARQALDSNLTSSTKADDATRWLYQAESSAVFEGYGSTDLAQRNQADQTLRTALINTFTQLDQKPPDYLNIPLVPLVNLAPDRPASNLFTPNVDGRVSDQEWAGAGRYLESTTLSNTSTVTPSISTSAISSTVKYITATYYGWDNTNMYLRLSNNRTWATIDLTPTVSFYFSSPHANDQNSLNFSDENDTPLGFGSGYEVKVTINSRTSNATASLLSATGSGNWQVEQAKLEPVFAIGQNLEIAIPWKSIPNLQPGDKIFFTALLSKSGKDIQQVPSNGAGLLQTPDTLNMTTILTSSDPTGDDDGSGTYTYPIDSRLYPAGSFDLTGFSAAEDSNQNLVLNVSIAGTLDNPLNAPNGFSLQTFDIYLHDPKGEGPTTTTLLPGRNARVGSTEAWNYAIVAEGWQPAVYQPDQNGAPVKTDIPMTLKISPDKHSLTITLALSDLGNTNPVTWSYLPAVLGTDNETGPGALRVMNVELQATPDEFGGAPTNPADANHTRIIDLIVPSGQDSQENLLSNYLSVDETDASKYKAANLPLLYMLRGAKQ